jgi:hypothetical protein
MNPSAKSHISLLLETLEERRVFSSLSGLSTPLIAFEPIFPGSLAPALVSIGSPGRASPGLALGALLGNLLSPPGPTNPLQSFSPGNALLFAPRFIAFPAFTEPLSFTRSITLFQPFDFALPSVTITPAAPNVNLPGSNIPGLPLTNPGVPPAGSQPGTNQSNGNPPVAPPTSTTPSSAGGAAPTTAPGTAGTSQAIGLLAFPLIPGYPIGTAYYTPASPPAPILNSLPPSPTRATLLEESVAFYLLPATDETSPPPDDLEDAPPDDGAAAVPRNQDPPPDDDAPPADADASWNVIPNEVRARAIQDLLRDADEVSPTEIPAG